MKSADVQEQRCAWRDLQFRARLVPFLLIIFPVGSIQANGNDGDVSPRITNETLAGQRRNREQLVGIFESPISRQPSIRLEKPVPEPAEVVRLNDELDSPAVKSRPISR